MIEFRTSVDPTTRSTQDSYNKIYRSDPIRQPLSFYLWALELADARPGQRLLDVACGVGDVSDLAARRGLTAVGIDLAEAALIEAMASGRHGDFIVANGEALPFLD